MKETNIDCLKYRKSSHLASVDVESIIAESGNCILTIKEAYYSKGIDVSGNKTDGYFLEFQEPVKPMVANSTNRKKIAANIKKAKNLTSIESRNISNWIGFKIELFVDSNVKMMGQIVDGIRIKEDVSLPILTEVHPKFNAVKKAIIEGTYTIENIKTKYQISSEVEKLISKK